MWGNSEIFFMGSKIFVLWKIFEFYAWFAPGPYNLSTSLHDCTACCRIKML